MSVSNAARACALLVAAAALTGACGDDDAATSTTTTTEAPAPGSSTTTAVEAPTSTTAAEGERTIEVAYAGGQVTGGVRTETAEVGDTVVLRVTSDVAEEVHVHSYDVVVDVVPGQTAELRFEASIPGRFEVELEKRGRQLLVLEVR